MSVSIFDVERSLLQKAVRRGSEKDVSKIVNYLLHEGDEAWLRKRIFVIAYEECWPIGSSITLTNLLDEYLRLTRSVKNKNASGLAALATKYNEGNRDVLFNSDFTDNIIAVASAINSPNEFWKHVESQPGYWSNWNRIEAAKIAASKAGFIFDKALMYASVCLTIDGIVPQIKNALSIELPYWVAFDKHTEIGRQIISEASRNVGLDPYIGMQLMFLMEGSKCNWVDSSPYWEYFVNWKLGKLGAKIDKCEKLVKEVIEISASRTIDLYDRINSFPASFEPTLFG